MITLKGIGKRFATGTEALRDLSFSVAEGEFVSLLGPSGCGKSTALRLVAGLLEPDAGHIRFEHGKPEIGFVFQEPTLMPWADALTNARLPLDLKRVSRRDGPPGRCRLLPGFPDVIRDQALGHVRVHRSSSMRFPVHHRVSR